MLNVLDSRLKSHGDMGACRPRHGNQVRLKHVAVSLNVCIATRCESPSVTKNIACVSKTLCSKRFGSVPNYSLGTFCTLRETLGIQVPFFFSSFVFILLPICHLNLDTKPGFCRLVSLFPRLSLPLVVASTSKVQAPGSHHDVFLSPMKNSSRAKCRGFACGGGKPGFWHVCADCGKRFCPKCVRPRCKHACIPSVPPAGSSDDKSELRPNESVDITRSEL